MTKTSLNLSFSFEAIVANNSVFHLIHKYMNIKLHYFDYKEKNLIDIFSLWGGFKPTLSSISKQLTVHAKH